MPALATPTTQRALLVERRRMREQRGGVAVSAEPHEDEIEQRPRRIEPVRAVKRLEVFLVEPRGGFAEARRGLDRVDVAPQRLDPIEQQPPRHAHIAQRIVLRNEAVVAHEPVHAIPRHLIAPRLFGEQAIESLRARARSVNATAARSFAAPSLASNRVAAVCARAPSSSTTTIWRCRLDSIVRLTDRAPAAAVCSEQPVGLRRAFAAGPIGRQAVGAGLAPGVQERLHDAPAGLDAVGARIQYRVAGHAVVDQRLVAGGRRRVEIVSVPEGHADAADGDRWTRHLGVEFETDAFVGLDAQHQEILRQPVDRRVAEHGDRRRLEADRDLAGPGRQVLASAQVEGHPGPAPIVDRRASRPHRSPSPKRDRRGARHGLDVRGLPQHRAGIVLTPQTTACFGRDGSSST